LGKRVRVRIALQVADCVGPSDRVRLAEQVVAEPDLGVRVSTADLVQRVASPRANLVRRDTQQRPDVVIALPTLE